MSEINKIQDLELSARELGRIMGLTDRQVRNLADQGIVKQGNARGKYRLHPSVENYIEHVSNRQSPVTQDLDSERLKGLRLQNDIRQGNLIPLDAAEALMAELIGFQITGQNSLPVRIAGDRSNRKEIERIEGIIEAMQHEVAQKTRKLLEKSRA